MQNTNSNSEAGSQLERKSVFRNVKMLVLIYIVLSLATVGATVMLQDNHDLVTPTVWVRGIIVAFTSLLMYGFASSAAKGSPKGLLRLRIAVTIMVPVIVVFLALPDSIPMWMKIEQGACGLVLLRVMSIIYGRRVRQLFR
ncbi:hypothetical protein [Streptomyces kasugaensis]|uniref:hypothetical protein n=1 Tax=Streptomyces kasugaensis TaxID=1946 RepID=UPI001A94C6E2|nr:hypothetical protein [Streptomyces kasugaensis]